VVLIALASSLAFLVPFVLLVAGVNWSKVTAVNDVATVSGLDSVLGAFAVS